MYVRLALQNVKRSAKDYLIYLLTMVLSVGLFYGFLSITSPFYNSRLPIQMNLDYFSGKMKIIVPLIALLLVFLISYVNRYMIKRRKKEFALQIIMGMEQRTVAHMFFVEMLLIGLLAIALGILFGILLSQIVSAIIMASFGESYHFYFSIFPDTIGWTIGFFAVLFSVIGFVNVRVIRKQKVIDMLHDEYKTESTATVKDMLLHSLITAVVLALCILLICVKKILPSWSQFSQDAMNLTAFCIINTAIFLLLVIVFLIATYRMKKEGSVIAALLSVSGLATGISLLRMQGLIDEMLRMGMISGAIYSFIPPLLSAGMIIFSISALFGCLSWLLVLAKRKSKQFRYRHLFLLGQITAKLSTNSKTMAVLTCVLLTSLVLLGWLPTMTGEMDGYLKARSIYDVQIFSRHGVADSIENLPKAGLDYSYIDAYLEEGGYIVTNTANVEAYYLKESDFYIRIQKDLPVLGVSLSDYNALLRLSGHEEISLPDGSFAMAWANTALPDEIERFRKENTRIQAGNYQLDKAPGADYQVNVGMGIFTSGMEAAYILPDSVCETLTLATTYYAANTTEPLSYDFALKLDEGISQWLNSTGIIPKDSGYVRLRTLQLNEGISNSLMFRLGGSYTSLVLMVICLTILALQQLTDATEHKHRFGIIEKLGLDKKQINQYIRQQMSVWFGIPVFMAFCGSGAVLTYLSKVNYRDYIPYVSEHQVFTDILSIYGIFILVLFCYFAVTYTLFKRNITE